jgi:L-2-hydroxyglutarate oxidase LhgO
MEVVIISFNYSGRKNIEALCREHGIPYSFTFPDVAIVDGQSG